MDEAMRSTAGGGAGALAEARLAQVVMYVRDVAVSRAFYEGVLGLELVEADEGSATYGTGQALLRLRRADDEVVTLPARDASADLTFLVAGLDAVRDTLAARGVGFSETLRYVIGATTGFHDPDGHRISLYEPSDMAMTWPSGEKIRELSRAGVGRPETGLAGSPLVYLFLFVPDADAALDFYHGVLGLPDLECRACRRGSTEHPRGVVKYDAGGMMLTTHLFEGAEAEAAGALSPADMKGLAPVFLVADVDGVVAALAEHGVRPGRVVSSPAGRTARFVDPFGRVFHLLEPSREAAETPGGARLARIAAAAA